MFSRYYLDVKENGSQFISYIGLQNKLYIRSPLGNIPPKYVVNISRMLTIDIQLTSAIDEESAPVTVTTPHPLVTNNVSAGFGVHVADWKMVLCFDAECNY